MQPPFSEDLVADLHAGVLDEATAAALLPAVLADPDSAALFRSLDGVRTGLAQIGRDPAASGPMPDHVAARLRRSLIDASSGPPGETGEPCAAAESSAAAASPIKRLRAGHGRGLLTAAAALVGGLLIIAPTVWVAAHETNDAPGSVAAESQAPGPGSGADGAAAAHGRNRPVGAGSGPLDDARVLAASGQDEPGVFTDPARLASCLAANGLPRDSRILGAGPVHIQGRAATLLLVPGPHPPILTGLVVTDDCGTAGAGLLYRTDIGG